MTLAEQIARIIDPGSFPAKCFTGSDREAHMYAEALARAEQAIAIVREEAAKAADAYHVGLKGIGARGWGQIHTARNISRDIRNLGSAS